MEASLSDQTKPVIIPNESTISSNNNKLQQLGEVIYAKHVKEGSSAYLAGLREGDRLISVNNVSLDDKGYSKIVSLIENW